MKGDLSERDITLHDRQRELGSAGEADFTAVLCSLLPSAGWILDAGGGSGTAVSNLRATGCQILLCDVSEAMLRAAVAKDAHRLLGDLTFMPLASSTVAGVFAAFALQNIPSWRQAVAELCRVVVPQGVVLVAWGNASPDPVVRGVGKAVTHVLRQHGATVGVAAEQAGLDTLDDGHRAFAMHGFAGVSEYVVAGRQLRSIRELVDIRLGNPFMSTSTPAQRRMARPELLAWAAKEFGSLKKQRTCEVELRLHAYCRIAAETKA